MFKLKQTSIHGLVEMSPAIRADDRGRFIKMFAQDVFLDLGLGIEIAEIFSTNSTRDVLRGMHLQMPPFQHSKLVACIDGTILDAVVDLRKNSLTFGRYVAMELSAQVGNQLLIPPGCAHGFLVRSDRATTVYAVSSVHAPSRDGGIRWDSFGFSWPVPSPILSERDKLLPPLSEFETPFGD
jgi:dTDP-4-dehydrorhamnose 3,5-epimerase